MGNTHKLQGTAAGLATAPLFVPSVWAGIAYVGLCTVCALVPDIDHPNSTITKLGGWATRFVSWVVRLISPHRGLTHSALGIGVTLVLLASFAPMWVAIACAVGCMTHVLGDMLTKAGVIFWWPFSKKKTRLARIKTGGAFEKWAVLPITFVVVVALIGNFLWTNMLRALS